MHSIDYHKKWKLAPTDQILEEIKKKNELRQKLLGYWSKQDCMDDIKVLQRILENRNKKFDMTIFLGDGI